MSSCITDPAAAAWAAKSAVSRATSIRSLSDAAVTVQRRWRLTRRMPYARPHQPAFHEATVQRRPQKVQWRVAPPPSQRQRRKAQQRAAPPPPRSNPHVVVMTWTPNAPNATHRIPPASAPAATTGASRQPRGHHSAHLGWLARARTGPVSSRREQRGVDGRHQRSTATALPARWRLTCGGPAADLSPK